MAGNTPDVRVRLSAEGVQEVVNAFKKIQAQAQQTQKSTTQGFDAMHSAAQGLAGLLPEISFAAMAAGAAAAVSKSLELADGMGKLHQKTGISVDTISVFSLGARTADVNQELLNKALEKGSRFFGEYDRGAQKARDGVHQLFGNESALKGLNTDQRLIKVTNALAEMGPSAKRTALAMDIFGKAGAELLPLMDDLGSGGFDKLRDKAEKLGLVVDSKMAQAAQRAKDGFTDLESEAQGMALQFSGGLAPALADTEELLLDITTGRGQDGFRNFGEFVGGVLRSIAALVASVVVDIRELSGDVNALALRGSTLAANIFSGNISGGLRQFRDELSTDLDVMAKESADKKKLIDEFLNGPEKQGPDKKSGGDNGSLQDLDELRRRQKARLALLKAYDEGEVQLSGANDKVLLEHEKSAYEQGTSTLQEYLQTRRTVMAQELKRESQAIQNELDRLEKAPLRKDETPDDRKREIYQLNNRLLVAQAQNSQQLLAMDQEQWAGDRANARAQMQAEADIFKAQGRRFDAERKALDERIAGLERLKGETDEAYGQRQGTLRTQGGADIDFAEQQDAAQRAMQSLQLARGDIERDVRSGVTFQAQGELQLAELEKQRLPVLQAIAATMTEAAQRSGKAEDIQAAAEFNAQLQDLQTSANVAGQRIAQMKAQLQSGAQQDIESFLTDGITKANSFAQAIGGLGASFVTTVQRMLAQAAAAKAVEWLTGIFGGDKKKKNDTAQQVAPIIAASAALGVAGATVQTAGTTLGVGAGALATVGTGLVVSAGAISTAAAALGISAAMLQAAADTLLMADSAGGGAGFATGGYVSGPGSGTSDSIRARLSNGEFVVRSAVVRKPGVLSMLRSLNGHAPGSVRARGVPQFASGGLVEGGGGQSNVAGLHATVQLDHGLLLKDLEASPEFTRMTVRHASANRNAIRQALGL